ncbi:O-antigen ligase family protein [Aureisphaera sp. CAU 1614]|uniref:O-antigen ligase family protein n=1 Tax=Halomarinibacterium sedimenti TaxID=2857106 RepID=A0A9X1FNQ2_9FLAO|nr:O-antigen ligase family protein [Halomarinibacterium sedimenti]MBW2937244.1 O-antigen ligase family protein [Halomarinibacterium sedimenti]
MVLNRYLSEYGLITLFVLFFALDALGKTHIFSKTTTTIPMIIKGIMSGGIILTLAALYKNKKVFILLLILALFFAFGQWTLEIPFSKKNLIIFGKFITPLIFFELFNKAEISKQSAKRLFNVFEWTIVINSVLIFVGFIFKIKLFESYIGPRFGYNGLFITSGVSSYCILISLAYFYFSYKRELWKNIKFWIFFVSCFFIGTKVVYLGILVFLIATISQLNISKGKYVLLLFATFIGALFYISFYEVGFFAKLTHEKGIVSSFLSLRNELFMDRTLPFIQENWDWKNYLFGGVSNYDLRSQMEVIDIFLFWGILGGIIYLYSYGITFVTFKMNKALVLFFVLFSIILLFTGNFFVYTMTALFLLILRMQILHSEIIPKQESHGNNS